MFTILYADGSSAIGRVRLDRERMWLTSSEGTTSVARQAVTRLVPGKPREANYWSGEVKLGITARSGNTDQTDLNGSFGLMRRTAKSRLPIQFDALYSEVNDQETANNQRFYTQYDRYLTERLYITPLGVDALRDTFQEHRPCGSRPTPASGTRSWTRPTSSCARTSAWATGGSSSSPSRRARTASTSRPPG